MIEKYKIAVYMINEWCKDIYILSEKRIKDQKFAFFTSVFAQKLQEIKLLIQYTQKDDLAFCKVILFINGILHP